MKKILIMAVVASSAIALHAASFTWTSGTGSANTYLWDTTTNAKATSLAGTIVLVSLGTTESWSWDNAVELTGSGATGTLTTSGKAAKIGTVGGAYSFTYGDPSTGALSNGEVLGVMFKDTSGELRQLRYVADDSLVSDTYTVSGLSADNWAGAQFNFATGGNFTASVPEPTSGLLMLLGMAGLALRRRRA